MNALKRVFKVHAAEAREGALYRDQGIAQTQVFISRP
jgi:hypothetical protein